MKYKTFQIQEDNQILDYGNDYEIAKIIGCTPAYINMLRHEKKIATFEFYSKLKDKLNVVQTPIL